MFWAAKAARFPLCPHVVSAAADTGDKPGSEIVVLSLSLDSLFCISQLVELKATCRFFWDVFSAYYHHELPCVKAFAGERDDSHCAAVAVCLVSDQGSTVWKVGTKWGN